MFVKYSIFGFSVFALFFSSCKMFYVPNQLNAPLMKEKGEAKLRIGFTNYQASYAVTNNIGILANVHNTKDEWEWSDLNNQIHKISRTSLAIEGGLGYFTKLDEDVVFEIYGGGGGGSINFRESGYGTGYLQVNTNRFFVQPSIGVSTKIVEAGLSVRWLGLNFYNYRREGISNFVGDEYQINDINRFYSFIEPALTFRVGYKYFKFHLQLGYSLNTSSYINYWPFIFDTGIQVSFANWYKGE